MNGYEEDSNVGRDIHVPNFEILLKANQKTIKILSPTRNRRKLIHNVMHEGYIFQTPMGRKIKTGVNNKIVL